MEFDWAFVFRCINTLGCLVALSYMATAAFRQWKDWSIKTQDHWWALTFWIFVGFEGAIESIILDTTPGPRIFLQTLAAALTLRALIRKGELKAHSESPWKRKE